MFAYCLIRRLTVRSSCTYLSRYASKHPCAQANSKHPLSTRIESKQQAEIFAHAILLDRATKTFYSHTISTPPLAPTPPSTIPELSDKPLNAISPAPPSAPFNRSSSSPSPYKNSSAAFSTSTSSPSVSPGFPILSISPSDLGARLRIYSAISSRI